MIYKHTMNDMVCLTPARIMANMQEENIVHENYIKKSN